MQKTQFNTLMAANSILLAALAGLLLYLAKVQATEFYGVFPSQHSISVAVLAVLLYACGVGFGIFRRYRQQQKNISVEKTLLQGEGSPWLIAYASQTGLAEEIARYTATQLQAIGLPCRVVALSQVTHDILLQTTHALWIVSTTGEGDAPDNALNFVRHSDTSSLNLSSMQYGLLALGDRSYPQFCAFGSYLDHWLLKQGATAIFPCQMVDNANPKDLQRWQTLLDQHIGIGSNVEWQSIPYQPWILTERECLNHGSQGGSVYRLTFNAHHQNHDWQAGDIAEILPHNSEAAINSFLNEMQLDGVTKVQYQGEEKQLCDVLKIMALPFAEKEKDALFGQNAQTLVDTLEPIKGREYSIASIPQENTLVILLRQQYFSNGQLGLGSAWLTIHARLHSDVDVRIRQNKNFHAPSHGTPLILIGNGTGIAGLRAHLKARSLEKNTRNWLIFGERNQAVDYFFQNDIEKWQANGVIERLDLAFSRDQEQRIYVQNKLKLQANDVREWVAQGAAIYVCGSMDTMAAAVHTELNNLLGESLVADMQITGRYRRDIY